MLHTALGNHPIGCAVYKDTCAHKPTKDMDLKRIRCTVVGDAGVGKTCLSRRFTFGTGPEYHTIKRTPSEDFIVDMMVDQQPVQIEVWNTAGKS